MLVDDVGRGETATAGSALSVGREDVPDPQVPERASRRTYPAQYKLDVLAEYDRLDKDGKGALMRREGLYSSLLTEWRRQRDRGALQALSAPRGPKPADPASRRTAELAAAKARLEAELATARSVIRIQGELSALLAKLSPSNVVPTCVPTSTWLPRSPDMNQYWRHGGRRPPPATMRRLRTSFCARWSGWTRCCGWTRASTLPPRRRWL